LLHEETLRLAKLVEDLLQLARADASRGTLRRKRIDLQELTSQALDLFRPKFATKGILVETTLSGAQGQVLADPEKLVQVMRNLLQNAWQYTPPGGNVRIFAKGCISETVL